jgi:2-polyprenyl-3-methyl-5-hydroxy-6-metoxy-1,4-benzoquinol methylase
MTYTAPSVSILLTHMLSARLSFFRCRRQGIAMNKRTALEHEKAVFDQQAKERISAGFVPDFRRLAKVEWFYNNVWREPEFVEIHWMPRIRNIIAQARQCGGRVLEVGCGYGMLSLELARNGIDVTGIDLSGEHIAVAERYCDENTFTDGFGSLKYLRGDIMEAEFGLESFDAVIFFRSFHHMSRPDEVMDKVRSILKTKGRLILSEPVRSHFTRESALFAAMVRLMLPTWESYPEKLGKIKCHEDIKQYVDALFKEYTREEEYRQSPLDNSIDDAQAIMDIVSRSFVIIEKSSCDAFLDKIIGGLRGEHRFELASFLKLFDEYLVKEGILPATSLELVAEKIR